jgi:hypothetical protein
MLPALLPGGEPSQKHEQKRKLNILCDFHDAKRKVFCHFGCDIADICNLELHTSVRAFVLGREWIENQYITPFLAENFE